MQNREANLATKLETNGESRANGSYVHFPSPIKSYFLSVLTIICSAAPGSTLAWLLVGATGMVGVWQAIATVMLAMVFSVSIFAGLVALGRALGFVRA